MSTKAWYRDSSEEKIWEPHTTEPPEYLDYQELYRKTGVRFEKLPDALCDDQEALDRFPSDRKYNYHDYLELTEENVDKKFYNEHLHEDPEIRLVVSGGGFFEVRTSDDRWVRIHLEKGEMLELPPGIWHRFTLDEKKRVKLLRLFSEIPVWSADFREKSENPPARDRYMVAMAAVS